MSEPIEPGAPPPVPRPSGPVLRSLLLVLAGGAAPMALLVVVAVAAGAFELGNHPTLALLIAGAVALGVVSITLIVRRRAIAFAVPCTILCAGLVLLGCTCWDFTLRM